MILSAVNGKWLVGDPVLGPNDDCSDIIEKQHQSSEPAVNVSNEQLHRHTAHGDTDPLVGVSM